MNTSIDVYNARATELAERYESVTFDIVHGPWLKAHPLPTSTMRVLDVGSGTGRDAAALAALGHRVLAVEPSVSMRSWAMTHHPHPRITWCDDRLPGLEQVVCRGQQFDFILISAVWQHLTPSERLVALKTLRGLCKPGGLLIISLRHGPFDKDDRVAYPCPPNHLIDQATALGLSATRHDAADLLRRDGVTWDVVAMRAPSKGVTAAMPADQGLSH